ncbi:hypothetical protein KEJ13_04575 [Candidatus Bathyarchaeota archaeon]|nr:hypothetical protein [Candidatus Bathyarchaeota archaeon]
MAWEQHSSGRWLWALKPIVMMILLALITTITIGFITIPSTRKRPEILQGSGASSPLYPRLLRAADYLASRYNPVVGLVSEGGGVGSNVPDGTPISRTYWVYSDNLWAQEALRPFHPQLAASISKAVEEYVEIYGMPNLFEVVLGEVIPTEIRSGRRIRVGEYTVNGEGHAVWVERHHPEDGDVFYDAYEYADLSFYLSLDYYLLGDFEASEWWFRNGEAMWRGCGFYDKAARVDGCYQNYKLGLYLFTARATGFPSTILDEVERVAWSQQRDDGGIASLSHLNGTTLGEANIEATSILLIAYNEDAIKRFQTLGSPHKSNPHKK